MTTKPISTMTIERDPLELVKSLRFLQCATGEEFHRLLDYIPSGELLPEDIHTFIGGATIHRTGLDSWCLSSYRNDAKDLESALSELDAGYMLVRAIKAMEVAFTKVNLPLDTRQYIGLAQLPDGVELGTPHHQQL
jgi:hypothetical protein